MKNARLPLIGILLTFLTPLAFALMGCGPNVGYVVKPVPISEELQETTLASDGGLFVSDKIVVVDVDGLLFNQDDLSFFGYKENPVALFIEKMDKAQKDPDVKAVVLRINSPGGAVTASDIMYRRLMEFRLQKKAPVVAVIEDVGASGAYYLACGADSILVHPTSITGSIGVIVQTVSFAGTMQKLGIDAKAVTSGKYKDMISPLKPLDADDVKLVQAMVDEFYGRFVKIVAAGRPNLGEAKVKALADGRVYTGEQALANGLADAVGYMDDAIALAKTRSGGRAVKVVMYHRPMGYKSNYYSAAAGAPAQMNMVNVNVPNLMALTQPQFLYLWTGRQGS